MAHYSISWWHFFFSLFASFCNTLFSFIVCVRQSSCGKASLLVNFSCYVLVCVLVSFIFEKYIDKPSINISYKFSKKIFSKQV